MDSKLARHYDPDVLRSLRESGRYTFKSLQQGAATSVFAATSPLIVSSGHYFENSQQAVLGDPGACGTDAAGVAAHALDPSDAERLWELSQRLG
jgi:hypothetical protein